MNKQIKRAEIAVLLFIWAALLAAWLPYLWKKFT